MAKPKKGVVPPQFLPGYKKKSGGTVKAKKASTKKASTKKK
jgi:hypothetical protein